MNYQTIAVEKKGHVGFLYLNRPEVLNALSEQMGNELIDFMTRAAADDDLRVLILTGKGRAFSAGAIRAAKALLRHGSHSTIEQVVEYESLVFQSAAQTQEHYDAVCRIMEELKQAKKK